MCGAVYYTENGGCPDCAASSGDGVRNNSSGWDMYWDKYWDMQRMDGYRSYAGGKVFERELERHFMENNIQA